MKREKAENKNLKLFCIINIARSSETLNGLFQLEIGGILRQLRSLQTLKSAKTRFKARGVSWQFSISLDMLCCNAGSK